MDKTEFLLEMEGYEKITYPEMIELIIEEKEIVLTTLGDQLYWRPRWPCHHGTNVQED